MKPSLAGLLSPSQAPSLGATHDDGATDLFARPTPFAGIADGRKGTISGWCKPNIGFGASTFLGNYFQYFSAYAYYDNQDHAQLIVAGYNQAPVAAQVLYLQNVAVARGDGFQHFIASWDLDTGEGWVAVDGVVNTDLSGPNHIVEEGETIAYVPTDATGPYSWATRAYLDGDGEPGFNNVASACQAYVLFHTEYLPPTRSSIRKFRTDDGKPANVGARGEKPFGRPPVFYSPKGDGHNAAGRGDLTPVGAPGVCGSKPPSGNVYLGKGGTSFDGVADYLNKSGSIFPDEEAVGIMYSAWVTPIADNGGFTVANPTHVRFTHLFPPEVIFDAFSGFDFYDNGDGRWAIEVISGTSFTNRALYNNFDLPLRIFDGNKHHLLAVSDYQTGRSNIYLDGLPLTPWPADEDYDIVAGIPFTLNFKDVTGGAVGAYVYASDSVVSPGVVNEHAEGCIAELFIETFTGTLPDFDDPVVMARFRTPTGGKAFLGQNGERPLGRVPLVYMPDGKTNKGRGGSFTPVGSPGDCP